MASSSRARLPPPLSPLPFPLLLLLPPFPREEGGRRQPHPPTHLYPLPPLLNRAPTRAFPTLPSLSSSPPTHLPPFPPHLLPPYLQVKKPSHPPTTHPFKPSSSLLYPPTHPPTRSLQQNSFKHPFFFLLYPPTHPDWPSTSRRKRKRKRRQQSPSSPPPPIPYSPA